MYQEFKTVAHVFLNSLNIKDAPEYTDKIVNRLEESIISLRCEDPYSYDQIMMMSAKDRQWVFESFLQLYFINEDNLKNQLIRAPYILQEIAADILDEPLVITEDFNNNIKNVLNASKDVVKSGLGTAYTAGKEFGKGMFLSGVSTVSDFAVNALKSIGIPAGLSAAMEYIKHDLPLIPESFLVRFILLYLIYFLKYPKDAIAVWTDLIDMFEAMVKTIKKGTDPIKYSFILTFKNEEECYKKAGLNNTYPSLRAFISLLSGSSSENDDSIITNFMGKKILNQSDTLRDCVLSGMLDRMQLFITAYMDCLKHTGNWNKTDVSDDKFVSIIRMNGNAGTACSEFLKNAQEAATTFMTIKKVMLRNDPSESHKWDVLMNRCIIDSKNTALSNTGRNFGDKFKDNLKHKELSRDL